MPVAEYNAGGVDTAVSIVGADGWRERFVPDWMAADDFTFGPNFSDD